MLARRKKTRKQKKEFRGNVETGIPGLTFDRLNRSAAHTGQYVLPEVQHPSGVIRWAVWSAADGKLQGHYYPESRTAAPVGRAFVTCKKYGKGLRLLAGLE